MTIKKLKPEQIQEDVEECITTVWGCERKVLHPLVGVDEKDEEGNPIAIRIDDVGSPCWVWVSLEEAKGILAALPKAIAALEK